jgi:hypothetical protein
MIIAPKPVSYQTYTPLISPQPCPYALEAIERVRSPDFFSFFQSLCALEGVVGAQIDALAERSARRREREEGLIRAWIVGWKRRRAWQGFVARLEATKRKNRADLRESKELWVVAGTLGASLRSLEECKSWLDGCHPDDLLELHAIIEQREQIVQVIDAFLRADAAWDEVAPFVERLWRHRGQFETCGGCCDESPTDDQEEPW